MGMLTESIKMIILYHSLRRERFYALSRWNKIANSLFDPFLPGATKGEVKMKRIRSAISCMLIMMLLFVFAGSTFAVNERNEPQPFSGSYDVLA